MLSNQLLCYYCYQLLFCKSQEPYGTEEFLYGKVGFPSMRIVSVSYLFHLKIMYLELCYSLGPLTNGLSYRPLTKEELEELSKDQKQQYFEELSDREKLFQKKQWREQVRRRKELKKQAAAMSNEGLSQPADQADEAGTAASVPIQMPDMALPPSFDSDDPTYRWQLQPPFAVFHLLLNMPNDSHACCLLVITPHKAIVPVTL